MKSVYALLSVVSAAKWMTTEGGPTFEITYDTTDRDYNFVVDSPVGQDLWLAYGSNCNEDPCDIAKFSTFGGGKISDSYGTISKSRTDILNDYKDIKVILNDDEDRMTLKASRARVPDDDVGKDVPFNLGTTESYMWVVGPEGQTGMWEFTLLEDSSVEQIKSEEDPDSEEPAAAVQYAAGLMTMSAALMSSLY